MKGGYIEYAPLPCDANGKTDWESTKQVGKESCVEYGTDGAEQDPKAAGFGIDENTLESVKYVDSKGITTKELDALIDQRIANRDLNNNTQFNADNKAIAEAIVAEREATEPTTV